MRSSLVHTLARICPTTVHSYGLLLPCAFWWSDREKHIIVTSGLHNLSVDDDDDDDDDSHYQTRCHIHNSIY